MVKFEFVLSDVDAENLFGCINFDIQSAMEELQSAIVDARQTDAEWFRKRIEYLKELRTKLTNTKIPA